MSLLLHIVWTPLGHLEEEMEEGLAIAWNLSQLSKLYEEPSVKALYLAERVTTQLIKESNAVPIAHRPSSFHPLSIQP
jgi:hypothetical protein